MAFRRLALALIAAVAVGSVSTHGQVPGQNINMVTGKVFPGGDPWLQKQNEPSGAVSTVNPCRLLAGANDYRAVNVPGNTGDKEIGDAWVGWYTSINCGQTWYSTLMPGYPQDTSPAGMASPVKGLSAAADPTVRAGAGGFFAYSFIAFNRGSNVGKVAIARFLDRNTTEAVTKPETAITYVDTKAWDTGSAGNYIDKPMVTVSPGVGTCTIAGRTIPASTVHLAWTVFVGNNEDVIRTKVYYARSSNCGATLDGPATKLSEGYAISQSASVAVAPNGAIYVVWRQFATPKGDINQILVAKSIDGGKSFTKGTPVPVMSALSAPFDQGTTAKSFRTNAYPAVAADRWGRLYVAVSVRGFAALDQARVVVTSTMDGVTWSLPQAIENHPVDPAHPVADYDLPGHQIMPAISAAAGKLNVVWLDFRDDVSGEFHKFIKEIYPIRHTMDVRGAQSTLAEDGSLAWTTYGILQEEQPAATAPRISKYLTGDYEDPQGNFHLRQLHWNRPNLKLYAGGTRPFMGDFIDVAGLTHLAQQVSATTTSWLPNDGSNPALLTTAAQTFYAFWTDNRDAKVSTAPAEALEDEEEEPKVTQQEGAQLTYVAPGTAACAAAGPKPPTKTRNANVYMARITPGLFVAAPTNSKPSVNSSGRIQRAFPVLVQNRTNALKTFRLTIANQPPDAPATGIATFRQVPTPFPSPLVPAPPALPPSYAVTSTDVQIPAHSSISRAVFIVSSVKYPQVRVNVVELSATQPLTGSTILNLDTQNADIENADIENADIENADIENREIHNADIENADIENADIENADIENADIENADIENADIENADIENADIENADIENADIENADIENADIENADIENGAVTDFSVDLTNDGNTATNYQVKFAVGGDTNGYIYQLIGRRQYKTPSALGCTPSVKVQNQILFNITDPDVTPSLLPDPLNAGVGNATILVGPGEKLKVTLRAFDKDGVTITNPAKAGGGNGSIQPFCPIVDTTGADCTTATNPVTVLVKAGAPNTGSNVPFEVIIPTNPAGAVNVTTTTLPTAATTVPYVQQLQAAGGLGTYSWTVQSGTLPPGLSLGPTGVLSGTPTTTGSYPFVVSATDGIQSDTQPLSILVVVPPTITTASVPGAIAGSPYGPRTLQATGGVAPYTWSIQSGSLPTGITINTATGTLTGTATTAGVSNFVVRIQDAASFVATKPFTINTMVIGAGDLIVADGAVLTTAGAIYGVSAGGAVQLIASIAGMPHAVAQSGSSFVVLDRTNNDVLRVTPSHVETLFDGPVVAGYIAVAVTPTGDIIIGDNLADKVYRLSGGTLTDLGNLPSSPSELQNVVITAEPSGAFTVADDTASGVVQLIHFSAAGVPGAPVTTAVGVAGGIAFHPSGDHLVADYIAGVIARINAAGSTVSTINVAGIGTMTGLALDPDGSLYASTLAGAVQHVSAAGGFTTVASGPPFVMLNDIAQFRSPVSVTTAATLAPAVYDDGPGTGGGRAYRQVLAASGISGTATWSVDTCASCNGLPFGLSLSSAGVISGTPDAHQPAAVPPPPDAAERTNFTFAARVTDSSGASATRKFTVPIHDYWENMTVGAPPTAAVNSAFLVTVGLRDASNAVIPGALIHLQITNNAGGATQFDLTATTDAAGNATFSVTIDQAGTGYTLVAWSPGVTVTRSNISMPIDVTAPILN